MAGSRSAWGPAAVLVATWVSLGTLAPVAPLAATAGPSPAAKPAAVPFLADDYSRALQEARRRDLPIFLEAWAPWCHTCRSMQAFVYTDAKLAPFADRFVWLAIDTEKAANAATVAKFPVGAWPSMYVIDPRTETIRYRWTGSATIDQLLQFLAEATATTASAADPKAAGGASLAAATERLAEADRRNGEAAWDAAANAYAEAIAAAPTGWAPLPRAADAYLFALQMADRSADCTRAARELLPHLADVPSSSSVAATGLDCAIALPADAPGRAMAIAELEIAARKALANPALRLAADDRSGLYISLIAARDDAGDEKGKKQLTAEWIALLEEAAERAPTPAARAVFDSHRLSAYLEIGEPQRALPMLEASAKDFPDDYNPPARLATAYRAMHDSARALAASDRALALAYGPRRLGILRTRAKVQAEAGDLDTAKKTLESTLAEARALPSGQVSARTIAAIEKEIQALAAAP